MSEDQVSLNEMIQQIRKWQNETNNFRNDGYTQEQYKEKIMELFNFMAPIVGSVDSRQIYEKYMKEANKKED